MTDIRIINLAQRSLGYAESVSIADAQLDSTARVLLREYPLSLAHTLARINWGFARKTSSIDPRPTQDKPDYILYGLPSDLVIINSVQQGVVEVLDYSILLGGALAVRANQASGGPVLLEYTSSSQTIYPELFVSLVGRKLAMSCSQILMGDNPRLYAIINNEYQESLSAASAVESKGRPQRFRLDPQLARSRYQRF